MTREQVFDILEKDTLIYTAAIHWNVVKSAVNGEPPRVIYIEEFITEVSSRILSTFDPSIMTPKAVMHLAHWYTENMIREQYARLINKSHT